MIGSTHMTVSIVESSDESQTTPGANQNRYIMPEDTIKEFKLKPHEIPPNMRLNSGKRHINFVNQNRNYGKMANDLQSVMYLSKIKYNIDNHLTVKARKNVHEGMKLVKN